MSDITIDPKKVRPLLGSTTSQKIAGADMQLGNLVYPSTGDEVALCDADTLGTVDGLIGMVIAATSNSGLPRTDGSVKQGERITILWFGRVAVGNVLDLTKNYFASNTPGRTADAAGTNARRVAQPESIDTLFFNGTVSSVLS